MNKPFILFSTPRSGSSPIYHTLAAYFASEAGLTGVEEILNPRFGIYRESSEKIIYESGSEFRPEREEEIFNERMRLVQKYHGKIFFKVFPSCFREQSTRWLLENFQFIIHERLDHFEQVLSFLTSISTNRWYDLRSSPPEKGSLVATIEDFRVIEGVLFHFHHLKRLIKPAMVITHEEFLRDGPAGVLANHGLVSKTHLNFSGMTEKQNLDDKLSYFSNPDDIHKWYQDSFFAML